MPSELKYLLDSDTFSNALRGHKNICDNIEQNAERVWLSIITVQQSLQGALDTYQKAMDTNYKRPDKQPVELASEYLIQKIQALSQYEVQPMDQTAFALFQSWPNKVRRIGAQDCQIAAIAVCHDFIVVTCDTDDFEAIANEARLTTLRYEDWSK